MCTAIQGQAAARSSTKLRPADNRRALGSKNGGCKDDDNDDGLGLGLGFLGLLLLLLGTVPCIASCKSTNDGLSAMRYVVCSRCSKLYVSNPKAEQESKPDVELD